MDIKRIENASEPNKIEHWMMSALLSLMEEKRYGDIKITEICEQAKLARCTFYRYYKTKEELLFRCCEEVFDALRSRLQQEDCNTFHGTATAYFSFWEANSTFLELLRKSDMLYFLTQQHDLLMFTVARKLKPEHAQMGAFDFSPKVRYHYFFGMWGFWGMTYRWIVNGCKETVEELAQYVVAYLVESYELEPACQYYDKHKKYPFDPCYIKPGNEF